MQEDQGLRSERIGTVEVARLTGSLDAESSQGLRDALEALLQQGQRRIVLDLREVRFIDSSGLSALVGSVKAARRDGGDIVLAGPSPQVRSIFQITRLDKVFRIEDDPAAACEAFDQ